MSGTYVFWMRIALLNNVLFSSERKRWNLCSVSNSFFAMLVFVDSVSRAYLSKGPLRDFQCARIHRRRLRIVVCWTARHIIVCFPARILRESARCVYRLTRPLMRPIRWWSRNRKSLSLRLIHGNLWAGRRRRGDVGMPTMRLAFVNADHPPWPPAKSPLNSPRQPAISSD